MGDTVENFCTKVTAHYSNGSTEDFDIFLLTGAVGLTRIGTDKGEPLYMGEEGKFGVMSLGRMAVPPDVVAAMVKSTIRQLSDLFASMPPDMALQLILTLGSIKLKATGHSEGRIKRINSQEN